MQIGSPSQSSSSRKSAFTLVEVVLSSALAGLGLAGFICGYLSAVERVEWAAYHLAAHSLAMQRLEQTRSAKWDLQALPNVDELVSSNFPTLVEVLDIPISKTNAVLATNRTTIISLSSNPPLKMVQVDCVWNFMGRKVFTNSVVTYRAPDQ